MAFKMRGYSAFTKTDDKNKIRVSNEYKEGDLISEEDLEKSFSKKGGNPRDYPQESVQDYSTVKKDKEGNYVTRIPN